MLAVNTTSSSSFSKEESKSTCHKGRDSSDPSMAVVEVKREALSVLASLQAVDISDGWIVGCCVQVGNEILASHDFDRVMSSVIINSQPE